MWGSQWSRQWGKKKNLWYPNQFLHQLPESYVVFSLAHKPIRHTVQGKIETFKTKLSRTFKSNFEIVCVCVHMCAHLCFCVCACTHACMNKYVHVWICMSVCSCVCVCVCKCVSVWTGPWLALLISFFQKGKMLQEKNDEKKKKKNSFQTVAFC